MGSSSAFTVGLLHGLYALNGQMPTMQRLAEESIYLEQEVLRETVGSQDQVLAAHGGFSHITFEPSGKIHLRPVILPPQRFNELTSHLMLFYTGIKRTAAKVAETYVLSIEQKRRQLRILRDMVEEAIGILCGNTPMKAFGELLHESWLVKRSLSNNVSSSEIDEMYEMAREEGAIGGKITGAGGGGFLLLFVPQDRHIHVRKRLKHLLHVPFNFEPAGSQIIFYDQETDYSHVEADKLIHSPASFREMDPSNLEPTDLNTPDR